MADRPIQDATEAPSVAGTKAMECTVVLCAFNFFDLQEFLSALRAVKWGYPEEVQVFIRRQQDERFSEIAAVLA